MNIKNLSFLVLLLMAFTGCSSVQKNLETSNVIPAANGQVVAANTDNGNVKLDLKVKYMAPPMKIRPGATNYVVWVRPGEGTQAIPQNIGALTIDDELNGRLKTLTPLKNFSLFITAEHSTQVSVPTGDELMWTKFTSGEL